MDYRNEDHFRDSTKMVEYIERETAIDSLKEILNDPNCPIFVSATVHQILESILPADIRPVVYGDWEWHGPCRDSKGTYWATCSVCKTRQRIGDYENFCPHCGADMRGKHDATP